MNLCGLCHPPIVPTAPPASRASHVVAAGQLLGQQLPPFVALRSPLGWGSNQETAGQALCGHHDRPPEALYECVALPSELPGLVSLTHWFVWFLIPYRG